MDHGHRPARYWANEDLPASLLRDVKGTARRKLIAAAWQDGSLDEILDDLLASLKAKWPAWGYHLASPSWQKAAQVIGLAL
jgi:hypothetical protein